MNHRYFNIGIDFVDYGEARITSVQLCERGVGVASASFRNGELQKVDYALRDVPMKAFLRGCRLAIRKSVPAT